MPITPITTSNIQSTKKHQLLNPVTVTGYGALFLGGSSVIAAKNKKIKNHVYLAYAAGALAIAHTAFIEWFKFKRNHLASEIKSNKK